MGNLLYHLNQWGIDAIVAIQARTGGTLDVVFSLITQMGDELFFLFLLPFLFWCIEKRQGARLAVLLFFSVLINGLLKLAFASPRPFIFSNHVVAKVMATGYAFPSGHAQNAATIWSALAITFRRPWITALAIILTLLIAFSRVYLGVHYPHDVIAGVMMGLLVTYIYVQTRPVLERWIAGVSVAWQAAVILLVSLLIGLAPVGEDALTLGGSMCGFGLGYVLERERLRFRLKPGWYHRLMSLGIGLATLLAIYVGMKVLAPMPSTALAAGYRFVRYACLGFVAVYVVPWILLRLSLATSAALTEICL